MNIEKLTSKDTVVIIFDHDGTKIPVYARVWFDGDTPIIAEPFADFESGRHWYNRETDFIITGGF